MRHQSRTAEPTRRSSAAASRYFQSRRRGLPVAWVCDIGKLSCVRAGLPWPQSGQAELRFQMGSTAVAHPDGKLAGLGDELSFEVIEAQFLLAEGEVDLAGLAGLQ